jgi:hypothetical protein
MTPDEHLHELSWRTSAAELRRMDFGSKTQLERREAAHSNEPATQSPNHAQVLARCAKRLPSTETSRPLPRVGLSIKVPSPYAPRATSAEPASSSLAPFDAATVSHERPRIAVQLRHYILLLLVPGVARPPARSPDSSFSTPRPRLTALPGLLPFVSRRAERRAIAAFDRQPRRESRLVTAVPPSARPTRTASGTASHPRTRTQHVDGQRMKTSPTNPTTSTMSYSGRSRPRLRLRDEPSPRW